MVKIKSKGDFKGFNSFLEKAKEVFNIGVLDKYGKMGVEALKANTPIDTGKTSESWDYVITHSKDSATITFINTNIQNGVNVAIVLRHGHATRGGYWVEGVNYIDPALKPVLEEIADNCLKEATKS